MRRSLLVALLVSITYFAIAQGSPADTSSIINGWQRGGTFSLALAQGGTRNWAPGGDRLTIALNGFLSLYANHTKNKCHWDNNIEANYGIVNTNEAGIIKNDDKLDLSSKLSYTIGKSATGKWRVGALANFRTQFYDGYDYDGVTRKRISSFLAPGIAVLSPGIEFYSKKAFNFHFSPFTGRWVVVANRPYELARNYNVLPNREVRIEAGAFASINYNKEVIKNISYRSRLDLFSDYLHDHPGNVDVYWTNMILMRINKYLGVVYNFDLQYDDDTKIFGYAKNKPSTQLKSIFGVGLTVTF